MPSSHRRLKAFKLRFTFVSMFQVSNFLCCFLKPKIPQSCFPAPSERAMAAAATEEYSCEFGSNKSVAINALYPSPKINNSNKIFFAGTLHSVLLVECSVVASPILWYSIFLVKLLLHLNVDMPR